MPLHSNAQLHLLKPLENMSNNKETLCIYLGGSNLYHLNTPESDFDHRGVFMVTDPAYIIGLNRFDEERKMSENTDYVLREFQNYMRLIQKANTEALECMFAPLDSFQILDPRFKLVRIHANDLINSEQFYKSLRGYAQGEYRLALGQRTGVLGAKRHESLKKYGFSPKNCTNLLRLLYTGIHFFKEDRYIVNCHDFGQAVYDKLFTIKTKPETYSVTEMERDYKDFEKQLDSAYNDRKVTHSFNPIIANWLIVQLYYPYLKDYYENNLTESPVSASILP